MAFFGLFLSTDKLHHTQHKLKECYTTLLPERNLFCLSKRCLELKLKPEEIWDMEHSWHPHYSTYSTVQLISVQYCLGFAPCTALTAYPVRCPVQLISLWLADVAIVCILNGSLFPIMYYIWLESFRVQFGLHTLSVEACSASVILWNGGDY